MVSYQKQVMKSYYYLVSLGEATREFLRHGSTILSSYYVQHGMIWISDYRVKRLLLLLTAQVSGEALDVKSCSQDQDIHLCFITILIHQCSSFHLVNAGSNNGDIGFGTGFQEIFWFGNTLTTNAVIYKGSKLVINGWHVCICSITRCENRDKIRTACTSESPSKDLFHKRSDPSR